MLSLPFCPSLPSKCLWNAPLIKKQAIAYSASRKAPSLAHIQSIYTSTFAILFFGTPHHGSSKARLLGSLQKFVRLAIPSNVASFESDLVNALKEQSEILQNINDQFVPLMAEFRIYFFWEQEKTDLKYTKDYVVEESSAAPALDNIERCGIAADHRGMCKFNDNSAQGFRTAIAALRRYARNAPEVVRIRHKRATKTLQENQVYQASDKLRGIEFGNPWLNPLNRIDSSRIQAEAHVLQRDNEAAYHIAS